MNKFKAFFSAFFIAFLCCLSVNVSAKAVEEIEYPNDECGNGMMSYFLITGFKEYPPFTWPENNEEDEDIKEYHGLISDIVRAALNNMRIERIRDLFFDDFLQAQKAVLRGKTDLLFTSYYTNDTTSGQDYIYPAYFGNPFVVVSRISKKIDVNDVSELKGLKGVARREEEVEKFIRGILPTDTKLEVVDGPEAAFRKLLSGEVDFMITSPYAADAEARRFKVRDKIHYGKKVLRHIKYFVAFSKLSQCRKYKNLFEVKFKEQLKDKAGMEKLIQEYIQKWADKHKDAPPLQYQPPAGE